MLIHKRSSNPRSGPICDYEMIMARKTNATVIITIGGFDEKENSAAGIDYNG